MTLLDRFTNAIENGLDNVHEDLEELNDDVAHGTFGWAWAMTAITLGLLMACVGAIITVIDSGGTHGPGILVLSGLMVLTGCCLLSTHES